MIKKKTKHINVQENKGEEGLNGLIQLTKPQEKKIHPVIKALEEDGVFD